MNDVRGADETGFRLLPAAARHVWAGDHRKRVGLNDLVFRASSRAQVDRLSRWVQESGYALVDEDGHPLAGGPDQGAVFREE